MRYTKINLEKSKESIKSRSGAYTLVREHHRSYKTT
nr:palindromic element RPE5 domain-containing protein [Rickettsia bellii]